MKKTSCPEGARELGVGEVAKRSGVAVSAIHFYESKGLLFSWRNGANWSIPLRASIAIPDCP